MVTEEQYAAVVAENAHLQQRVTELTAQLQVALGRIAALETQVTALQAQKTPPPSFVKANVPTLPAKSRAQRAAEHNHGRPRQQATQVVGHAIRACPDCGSALGGVQIGRTRQVIELPAPPPVQIIEHQVQRGWCSACRRWREAPLDLRGQVLGAKGRFGVGIAAVVAHLRTRLRLPLRAIHLPLRAIHLPLRAIHLPLRAIHLPLRAIQRYLADLHGLQVSVGELVELLHRVAAVGAPTVAQIRERVCSRAVVHADETSWREAGRNGYVWGLATPEGERYFAYAPSRAGAVINALLGADFRGVLVTDFSGGYNDTPGGQHQRCWVQLLRDVHALAQAAQDAAQATGALSREGLETRAWTAAVTALWQRVRAASTSPPADAAGREASAQTLLGELQALGAQFVEQLGHPCRALAWRLWHFQGELLTCVRQPAVPADNNPAERALRPLVVARKISGGTRAPRGSDTGMALMTLAATWTASGLDAFTEFRRLLQAPLPQV